MTHEEELRAINLADAAARAYNANLVRLGELLQAQAEKLLGPKPSEK
ncbi:hypothetical protein [Pseudomonas lactis]|nr:hypothetical protein [Pseudomonas lactis]MBA6043848.1 hypothetical protein [Pseudomonas lactis]